MLGFRFTKNTYLVTKKENLIGRSLNEPFADNFLSATRSITAEEKDKANSQRYSRIDEAFRR